MDVMNENPLSQPTLSLSLVSNKLDSLLMWVAGAGGGAVHSWHPLNPTAAERKGNSLQRFEDFFLQAMAIIWP